LRQAGLRFRYSLIRESTEEFVLIDPIAKKPGGCPVADE
jgi:hypothetical protein